MCGGWDIFWHMIMVLSGLLVQELNIVGLDLHAFSEKFKLCIAGIQA